MSFEKYIHLEKFNTEEVLGIDAGIVYVFPKLDGTNASVWYEEEEDLLCAGSRNRELSLNSDNAGFYNWVVKQENIINFLKTYPSFRLYGEWLVPHTLKTYRDDAWNKLYVFDVECNGEYLHYDIYSGLLKEYNIEYIPPICVIKNPSFEQLNECLKKNIFYIKDGEGVGEGIVIKNYDFKNKYGRQVWAKLITNEFKTNHHKEMGVPVLGGSLVEEKIVEEFVTHHLIDKVLAKIKLEKDGWLSQYIPMLLGMVFYDLVREEIWQIIKKYKNPSINFKMLNSLTILQIKKLKPELF